MTSTICLVLILQQVALVWTLGFDHAGLFWQEAQTSRSASSRPTDTIRDTAYQRVITKQRKKQWGRVSRRDHTSVLHISGEKATDNNTLI